MLLRLAPHRSTLRPLLLSATRNFAGMPSNDMEAKNASGLTPNETNSLKERSAQPHEEKIVQGIKELYSCKPSEETYKIYSNDAVFHDPIGIAEGIKAIRAQFNGLVKIFPRADVTKFRILENPSSVPKSTILIDQDVAYYRDPSGSPTKTVNSLLTLQTNDAHQITRHTEEWDHKRETTRDDGFLGLLNEQRKKITASVTGMFISQDPPEGKNST
ncbi:uncharacterized protein LAESUDRAFT_49843 [Laetiporus sulphureus 93-53]|uniref:Uncharacterized protein n=1 Tax=Laetiporus sulphureus 93-53 TaxID=1314785 RepID=A0A165FAR3_9APHY|nr:uncharacterized protein LAESUDRAFT_49843 [Laetiporus sulphureus 93-53]KZT08685.1 hypothetical protein LAESUDRAFT_49843 [Laetiporus sulphureus 93-53]